MKNLTDETLAARAAAGDNASAGELIGRYKATVKQLASSYFIAGADRDDVIQEGMIGLFGALKEYDPTKGAAFRTFAELCIRRQIISAVRGASRLKHYPLNESLSLSRPADGSSAAAGMSTLGETIADIRCDDPQKTLVLTESIEYLENNREEIFSDLEWQAWKMHAEGICYREIAERLGKSPKSVDNALCRARSKMAEVLGRDFKRY